MSTQVKNPITEDSKKNTDLPSAASPRSQAHAPQPKSREKIIATADPSIKIQPPPAKTMKGCRRRLVKSKSLKN
jgi:hypothetical protein